MYLILGIMCLIGQVLFFFLASSQGRKSDLKNSETNIVNSIEKLDSTTRAEILNKINITAPEIISLVNKHNSETAREIVMGLNDKFHFIETKVKNNTKNVEGLTEKEKLREAEKNALEKLKNTKPEVKIESLAIEKNNLVYTINLKNKVPINLQCEMFDEMGKGVEITGIIQREQNIIPRNNSLRYKLSYNTIDEIKKYGKLNINNDEKVMIRIRYSSIYNGELRNDLYGEVSEYFKINIANREIIKI